MISKSLYEKYFKQLNLKATVIYKNKYGNGEPTDTMMDNLLEDFNNSNCTRIIAIGGGTVIDMAKILVLKNGKCTEDIFYKRVPLEKVRPLIAIPTTCGTGSEVSNISVTEMTKLNTKMGLAIDELYPDYPLEKVRPLIAIPTTCGTGSEVSNISVTEMTKLNTKMGLAIDELYPDYAVLIPELLTDLPYKFFAASAIDALIHAIESYMSPKATIYTELYSKEAMNMILEGFQKIVKEGHDARLSMLDQFLI